MGGGVHVTQVPQLAAIIFIAAAVIVGLALYAAVKKKP
jgi:hypothetical protein